MNAGSQDRGRAVPSSKGAQPPHHGCKWAKSPGTRSPGITRFKIQLEERSVLALWEHKRAPSPSVSIDSLQAGPWVLSTPIRVEDGTVRLQQLLQHFLADWREARFEGEVRILARIGDYVEQTARGTALQHLGAARGCLVRVDRTA